MRSTLLALAALAALAAAAAFVPAPASAQLEVHAGIRFPLPLLPTLVIVQPGVQVVQDFDDEVFLHGGVYWARRGDRWYRGRGPQAEFVIVETRLVPEPLRRLPPGHYRRYRPPPPVRRQQMHEREERHEDKKEEKRRRKEEDKAQKEREKEHGQEHREGPGKGH